MNIEEIIDEFKLIDNWEDKYAFIIDLGNQLEALTKEEKIDQNKVSGCTSQVWLIRNKLIDEKGNQKFIFKGDSDSLIVKGLIGILFSAYSNKSKEEISNVDIEDIFNQLNLKGHLSPNRSNGFFSIVTHIKNYVQEN